MPLRTGTTRVATCMFLAAFVAPVSALPSYQEAVEATRTRFGAQVPLSTLSQLARTYDRALEEVFDDIRSPAAPVDRLEAAREANWQRRAELFDQRGPRERRVRAQIKARQETRKRLEEARRTARRIAADGHAEGDVRVASIASRSAALADRTRSLFGHPSRFHSETEVDPQATPDYPMPPPPGPPPPRPMRVHAKVIPRGWSNAQTDLSQAVEIPAGDYSETSIPVPEIGSTKLYHYRTPPRPVSTLVRPASRPPLRVSRPVTTGPARVVYEALPVRPAPRSPPRPVYAARHPAAPVYTAPRPATPVSVAPRPAAPVYVGGGSVLPPGAYAEPEATGVERRASAVQRAVAARAPVAPRRWQPAPQDPPRSLQARVLKAEPRRWDPAYMIAVGELLDRRGSVAQVSIQEIETLARGRGRKPITVLRDLMRVSADRRGA